MSITNSIEIIEDGQYVMLSGFTYLDDSNVDFAAYLQRLNHEWVKTFIKNDHTDVQEVFPFFLKGCKQERNGSVSLAGYTISLHSNGMYKIFSFTRINGVYKTYGLNYDFNDSLADCITIISRDHKGFMLSKP